MEDLLFMATNEITKDISDTYIAYRSEEQKKQIEKMQRECFIKRPLNTYDECWKDVHKWFVFDTLMSYRSYIIFQQLKNDFTKYPIEYQMSLLMDLYTDGVNGKKLKSLNTVLRKIYKSEPKEFKDKRTKNIRNYLNSLGLIKTDESGAEYIEVFRGANCQSAPNDIAISWTHSIDSATLFANRFADLHQSERCCKLYCGKIKVKDIIDVSNTDEDEIIAFPHKVYDIEEIRGFVADYTGNWFRNHHKAS